MTKLLPKIYLTIRQKVLVGFACSIVAFLLISVVAYRNLVRIEWKLRFVESSRALHDTILESRRYEKNYLLYGQKDDHHEALNYLEKSRENLKQIEPEVRGLEGATYLEELKQEMARYGRFLNGLVASGNPGTDPNLPDRKKIEARLRQTGKKIVDLSMQLANFEHNRIQKILLSLKRNLFYLLTVLIALGFFLIVLVSRKIVKPLTIIETTTRRIAKGNFQPLEVQQTQDETQAVVEAFNTMIDELEKRQDQLVKAQKLSALGILTSGIAHQLNNPLNNISTSCQILVEELDDDEGEYLRKLLINIDQEVDRARDIVTGLLDFSRDREFQRNLVNLDNLILRTTRLVASELPPGVEITSNVPEDLDITVDVQKVQEVLLNLLLNAAQALKGGVGLINITARKDDSKVLISIQDNGSGIRPEHLPYIFDPFFTTKEVGYGSGLGLSVAHGIVEQHGGTLSVNSRVGEGSTFTIVLPLGSEKNSGDYS